MFKNPVVKDGIKALAIFLLPFIIYFNLIIPRDLDLEIWKLYQKTIFDTLFEGLVYIELSFTYYLGLTLIWLKTTNNQYFLGVSLIVLAIISNLVCYPFPIYYTNIPIPYWLPIYVIGFIIIYKIIHVKKRLDIKSQNNLINYILIIISFLVLTTFGQLIPSDIKVLKIGPFSISSYGFYDFNTFYFILFTKIYILSALLLWFFTEKSWWRYAILSPILLLTNQSFNILFTETNTIDEIELYQSGPFLLTILIALLILAQAADNQERIKTFLRLQYQNIEHAVEQRFGKQQQNIEEKKQRLATKKDLSKKELAALKKELEEELNKLA